MSLDAHIDLPWQMLKHSAFNIDSGADYSTISTAKLKQGGLDKAIYALYVSDQLRKDHGNEACWEMVLKQRRMLPPGSLTAMEGGGILDGKLSRLEYLSVACHIKYLTLVHNHDLPWVESATDGAIRKGLNDFGKEVVRDCENLGIVVDVSHASDATIRDVLDNSIMPIVATHSGARSITDHPRNLSDDLIKEIAKAGGVIGVPFAKRFVGSKEGFVRHIDHIVDLVGVDSVGIGSDLDGAVMIDGVISAGDWSFWKQPLRDLGYCEEVINLIAGENFEDIFGGNDVPV